MPDEKYNHCVSCEDYNILGEPCPLSSVGECKILGQRMKTPFPDDMVCDKVPGPITNRTIVLFDLDDDYAEELMLLHKSDGYRQWQKAWWHYRQEEEERRKAELNILYDRVIYTVSGQMTRREFKKRFKPKGLGVVSGEASTFRMRVLDWLLPKLAKRYFRETGHSKGSEKVVFIIEHLNDRYVGHDNDEVVEEWLDLKFLTRGTFLEDEVCSVGMDDLADTGLSQIMADHVGKKVLVEVHWWSAHDGPDGYDADGGIKEVRLLKVLG